MLLPRGFGVMVAITLLEMQGYVSGEEYECELQSLNTTVVYAYTGWPFRVDCRHLRAAWESDSVAEVGDSIVTCRLYRDGVVQTENIFELDSMTDNTTFIAELVINGSRCYTNQVLVDLRPFPNETCEDSLDDSERLFYEQKTFGDSQELKCGIEGANLPDIIPEGVDRQSFTTKWITSNCQEDRYRYNKDWREKEDKDDETFGNILVMPDLDFYDAVNFTCSVTYKGKTLYPITYSQCIKQRTRSQIPTLTCVKRFDVPVDGSVKFDCGGQMTAGMTKAGDFLMQWKKDKKVVCQNEFLDKANARADNGRYSCLANDSTQNEPIECYYYNEDGNPQRERKTIALTLEISEVEKDDFGNYAAVFMTRVNGEIKAAEVAIELVEDRTPYLRWLVKVLTGVLAALISMAALAYLIWRYRIYFLVAYKRSTLWKYDKDNKMYIACLSYHYDREDETPEGIASSEASLKIVTTIQNFMKDNDYKYYDEQREGNFGPEVETITNLMEICHRMVLVLTPKYLEDRWKRFHADLSFRALVDSGMGLVLIVTPGVKKLLAKKAKDDKVWKKLRVALRTNRVINWTEKMSEKKLLKHIEYGMPKLDKRKKDNGNNNEKCKEDDSSITNSTSTADTSDQFIQV